MIFKKITTESIKEAKPLEDKITLEDLEKACLDRSIESGMYETENKDLCNVIVMFEQGVGFDVYTFLSNGWLKVNHSEYLLSNDEEIKMNPKAEPVYNWYYSETYNGKWN